MKRVVVDLDPEEGEIAEEVTEVTTPEREDKQAPEVDVTKEEPESKRHKSSHHKSDHESEPDAYKSKHRKEKDETSKDKKHKHKHRSSKHKSSKHKSSKEESRRKHDDKHSSKESKPSSKEKETEKEKEHTRESHRSHSRHRHSKNHKSSRSRSRSRHRPRGERSRSRSRHRPVSNRREPSRRDRETDRYTRTRHERDGRDARNGRSRYDRHRRSSSRSRAERKKQEEEKRRQKEEKKREEEEYQRKVEEQLASLENEQHQEDEEERLIRMRQERRKKRAVESSPQASPQETPIVTGMSPIKAMQNGSKVEEPAQNGKVETKSEPNPEAKSEQPAKEVADEFDMFNEDMDAVPVATEFTLKGKTQVDAFDDHEGYYLFRPGDILNGRWEVYQDQGRGMFSSVFRVRDREWSALTNQEREMVIKVTRNNEVMTKNAMNEIEYLQRIAERDPENRKYCIRLHSTFYHRDHLCLVFEAMDMNLRDLINKKLAGQGLNVMAVRQYARSLFTALRYIGKLGYIHADLKPDNILVNKERTVVKLADFGSVCKVDDNLVTPYLCSRFYRAPEIMIGLKYGPPSDVWSLGCVLFEVYTGKILFQGDDNNAMLKHHIELMGKFPAKVLKSAEFADQHFDNTFTFYEHTIDPATQEEMRRPLRMSKATRDLLGAMHPPGTVAFRDLKPDTRRVVGNLKDLLERCLHMDPAKRITSSDALKHPFFTQK